MGLLDSLGSGVPGGNVSKPILIALGALLASKALGGGGLGSIFGGMPGSSAVPPAPPGGNGGFFGNAGADQPQPSGTTPRGEDGGLLGGLGGLVRQFEQNGLGHLVQSWVGTGPNQPLSPGQLHQGLGPEIVDALVQKTGLSRDQLLAELSKVLPGIVDTLTPEGRVPAAS
jgi:uncharacterized protein YidB (DUF937 family)